MTRVIARSVPRGKGATLHAMTALVLVSVAGCFGDGLSHDGGPSDAAGAPDAYRGPATALFELPRPGRPPSEFYALPFPNDLRLRDNGTIDFDDHAHPTPLLEEILERVAANAHGFGTNAAVFFRFSAPIDSSSLPATPEASLASDASVYLVDVDPTSPERGRRRPLLFRFEPLAQSTIGTNWLSCLPYPGMPLRPETTYAVVVTGRLLATDGSPVGRAVDLQLLLATGATSDATVASARGRYAPLLGWLDEPGDDERADVVSATVFTTQDPTSLMRRVREVVWRDAPAPVARDLAYRFSRGQATIWSGVYDGPNFQTGTPPYMNPADGGGFKISSITGEPLIRRFETIRFAVSVPSGTVPETGWPIVLYAHGTGGDYLSFLDDGTASTMAAAGLAVISIDQVLHGTRNPLPGTEDIVFFNVQNPAAARDNVRQGALDDFQLVRLVLGLAIDEGKYRGGRVHHFDPDRIYFMGHSQGGLTGPPFLAYEPYVKGAILSGAGGVLIFSILKKTEPVDIPALAETLLRDYPLDEYNNQLALLQTFMEPADPVNYARLLTVEPAPDVGAKDVFQSEGLIDHYTPNPCIEALGLAAGLAPVAPLIHTLRGFDLAGRELVWAPVSGNLNGKTGVFVQYQARPGDDGHFVIFDLSAARAQSTEFLASLARTGTAVLEPH